MPQILWYLNFFILARPLLKIVMPFFVHWVICFFARVCKNCHTWLCRRWEICFVSTLRKAFLQLEWINQKLQSCIHCNLAYCFQNIPFKPCLIVCVPHCLPDIIYASCPILSNESLVVFPPLSWCSGCEKKRRTWTTAFLGLYLNAPEGTLWRALCKLRMACLQFWQAPLLSLGVA